MELERVPKVNPIGNIFCLYFISCKNVKALTDNDTIVLDNAVKLFSNYCSPSMLPLHVHAHVHSW